METTFKINTKSLVFLIFFLAGASLEAQDVTGNYIDKTGLFSRLYSGKIESPYRSRLYEGTPYYNVQNYTDGSIVFGHVRYTGQKIRLDLYKQQAVIFSPANQSVVLPSKKVQQVDIYGKTFIWVVPGKDSGLKNEGFYISCFTGGKINLLCEERFFIPDEKANPRVFEKSVKYYLGIGGKYYHVRNKSDFLQLFPENKKQINKYARDSRLDFVDAKERSMIALAAFCNEL